MHSRIIEIHLKRVLTECFSRFSMTQRERCAMLALLYSVDSLVTVTRQGGNLSTAFLFLLFALAPLTGQVNT